MRTPSVSSGAFRRVSAVVGGLLCVLAVTFTGCSPVHRSYAKAMRSLGFVRWVDAPAEGPNRSVVTARELGKSSPSEPQKEAPVAVAVHQVFFVGQVLTVKVRVTALAHMTANDVIAGVRGLREGQVLERQYRSLGEVTGAEVLHRGESYLVTFELPSSPITEYQVVCAWGGDAAALRSEMGAMPLPVPAGAPPKSGANPSSETTASSGTSPSSQQLSRASLSEPSALSGSDTGALGSEPAQDPTGTPASEPEVIRPQGASGPPADLIEVELEQAETGCRKPPCDLRYTVRARLVNRQSSELVGAKIAVGLVWSAGRSLPKTPAHLLPITPNESVVTLEQLHIPPKGTKRLKIGVDRSIPQVPGGRFFPYIRIAEVIFDDSQAGLR